MQLFRVRPFLFYHKRTTGGAFFKFLSTMYKYDPTSCILTPKDRTLEIRHQHFVITPDFQKQILTCKGVYTLTATDVFHEDACSLCFDVNNLTIDSVSDASNSQQLKVSLLMAKGGSSIPLK